MTERIGFSLLTELVENDLSKEGKLCQMNARMRQIIFNAAAGVGKGLKANNIVQSAQKVDSEKLTLMLVKELLTFYEMKSSETVFSSESGIQEKLQRSNLALKSSTNSNENKPLLLQIVQATLNRQYINKSAKGQKLTTQSVLQTQGNEKQATKRALEPEMKDEASKKTIDSRQKVNLKTVSTKFDNPEWRTVVKYDAEEISESIKDFEEISDDEAQHKKQSVKKKNTNTIKVTEQKKNPLFSSMDETIGASQSHGQDQSVNSLQLEEYNYYEDIG